MMTLLNDLATVFFSRYGWTNAETKLLINVFNYYHEYEEDFVWKREKK